MAKIQIRRGTSWANSYTLAPGEFGFDITNGILKIGNGTGTNTVTWQNALQINSGITSTQAQTIANNTVAGYSSINTSTGKITIGDNSITPLTLGSSIAASKITWGTTMIPYGNIPGGSSSTTFAYGNHTHTTNIATSTGTNQITLAANTKYAITAGGTSYVFTTPPDTNTTYESKSASSGGTAVSLVTTGEKYTWNNKSNLTIGTTATTAAAGNHTHSQYLTSSSSLSASNISWGTSVVPLSNLPVGSTESTLAVGNHGHKADAITSGTLDAARLPIATANALGGIKVGSGLSINSTTGVLSVTSTSGGTVTSVQVQASSPLQSSTSTAQTTSLNTTISFANQSPNKVLAGPSSGTSAGAPSFRTLVAADIPSLDASKITSGQLGVNRIPDLSGTYLLTTGGIITGDDVFFKKTNKNTLVLHNNASNPYLKLQDTSNTVTDYSPEYYIQAYKPTGDTKSYLMMGPKSADAMWLDPDGNVTIHGTLTVNGSSVISTVKQDGITGATINRFGSCTTTGSTAAKTVSIKNGTFSLEAGARVTVRFGNKNTANSPTLNVEGTGAKNIFSKGIQITDGTNKNLLYGAVDFVYDGTQYHLIGNYMDDTTGTASKTGTKMYLVGATEQAANPQTYSNSNCYIGTDNCLYSGGSKVLTSVPDLSSTYLPLTGGKTLTGDVSINYGKNFKFLNNIGTSAISMYRSTDGVQVTGSMGIGNSAGITDTLTVYGYINAKNNVTFEEDLTVDGLIYGTVSGGSDIRYKDVVKEDYMPTVKQIADAPAIQFTWKDKENKALHVGTSAQYWQEVMPEIVHEDKDGKLSIEYATAGLLSAISVARVVEQYENRIKALEDKIAAMEGSGSGE